VGNFDDCRLTLVSARDPVCTPEGVVFSKEAILEYLVHQKKDLKKKLATYEDLKKKEDDAEAARRALEEQARVAAFERVNQAGMSEARARELQARLVEEAGAAGPSNSSRAIVSGGINITSRKESVKEVKAFWGASKTPEAGPTPVALLDKPKDHTTCPITGKKLRLKDLVDLKFTRVDGGEGADAAAGGEGRYMDPITKDVFTNRSRLVCLRTTGDVFLHETFKKLVEPEGTYKGLKIHKGDAIELQRGGTGFAAHDKDQIEAKSHFTLGVGSGMTDLRGQHQGGGSKFGLVLY
jgi:nitric oxide synthase-interacting protein